MLAKDHTLTLEHCRHTELSDMYKEKTCVQNKSKFITEESLVTQKNINSVIKIKSLKDVLISQFKLLQFGSVIFNQSTDASISL